MQPSSSLCHRLPMGDFWEQIHLQTSTVCASPPLQPKPTILTDPRRKLILSIKPPAAHRHLTACVWHNVDTPAAYKHTTPQKYSMYALPYIHTHTRTLFISHLKEGWQKVVFYFHNVLRSSSRDSNEVKHYRLVLKTSV